MPTETVTNLNKIVRAMHRGTLVGVTLQTTSRFVQVGVDRFDNAEVVAWFEKNFPGGEHRHASRTCRRVPGSRRSRKSCFFDLIEYVTDGVILRYWAEHVQHFDLTAREDDTDRRSGEVLWRCGGCRQALTITEARERGLIASA